MKVLKRPNTNWSYKYTCTACTAELEVEKNDVRYRNYPGDCHDPDYETWQATCAVCYTAFNVPLNTIPKILQLEIKNGLYKSILDYQDR